MRKLVILLCIGFISFNVQANSNTGRVEKNNESTERTVIEIQVRVLPNPVIETGEVEFTLVEDAKEVYIYIANSAGKIVSELPIGETPAGTGKVLLNVDGLNGYYIVGIQAGLQAGNCKIFVK